MEREVSVVSGVLGKLAGFSALLGSGSILIGVQSLNDIAVAMKSFGTMQWEEIGKGLAGMGGALAEVATVSGLLGNLAGPLSLVGSGSLLLGVQGLGDLADALKKFGEMSWTEIGHGLTAMGSAMGETAIGGLLNTLSGFGAHSIATLAEPLMFALWDDKNGSGTNNFCASYFIPKTCLNYWHYVPVFWQDMWRCGTKTIYVEDTQIIGHSHNYQQGTGVATNIKYTSSWFVLRRVYGI